MTKDEALRIALEALENAPIEYDFHGNPMDAEFGKQLDAAITAIRQALEESPNSTTDVVEPEPVAWCEINSIGEIMYFDGRAMIMPGKFGNDLHTVPLYTAPPKREWVGLNNVEVGRLTVFDGLHHVETLVLADFIRAIEAKLKEKNHA